MAPIEKRLAVQAAHAAPPGKKAPEKGADDADPEDDVEMTFFEHLGELRTRFVRALYGLIPGVGAAWYFKEQILEFLTAPLIHSYHTLGLGDPQLHFANPADPFMAYVMIAMICGLIFASPWAFYQAWAFIAPGLYRNEKRLAVPFMLASAIFFVGGAFFGYAFVLPPAFDALLSFSGMLPTAELRIQPTIMMLDYLDFSLRMLLALGIVFEVPIVIGFLSWAGLVNWRQLLDFSRWWVVISAFAAAILTPSGDAGTMMLVLIPLVVLYYIAIGIAFVVGPKPPPKAPSTPEPDKESAP